MSYISDQMDKKGTILSFLARDLHLWFIFISIKSLAKINIDFVTMEPVCILQLRIGIRIEFLAFFCEILIKCELLMSND